MKKKLFLGTVSLLLLAGVVVGVKAQTTSQIYLTPTPLILEQVGGTGTLEVRLSEAASLSAFEARLSYDSGKIHIDAIEIPSSVGGTRVGPTIDNEGGEASFGSWTANREGGGSFNFVNILAGQEAPVLLATISLTAVGEGSAPVSFVGGYTNLLGTEAGEGEEPTTVESETASGLVQVGTLSGTEITLRSGGNNVIWPAGLGDFTSLSALESVAGDCGGAVGISRKKGGWWESAVYGYGGVGFALSEGSVAHIRVASSCVWSP